LTQRDGKLLVTFSDNGVGISPRSKKKLFDFGYTTTGGSGLGLTHIQEILQKINSKIDLIDKEGDGAAFLITFNN
jgi:signal transduction histidine kinase